MLKPLLAILDEAEKYAPNKKFDFGVLLHSRQAPDQFDFIRQLQIACDTEKFDAARLTDTENVAPAHADIEPTLSKIKARIESVIAYLNGFSSDCFPASVELRISQARWEGRTLSGYEYLIQHFIPNFYFHVTSTYSILRHNGVGIGKKIYLGALPYREPV
jgi:hypothetical protein